MMNSVGPVVSDYCWFPVFVRGEHQSIFWFAVVVDGEPQRGSSVYGLCQRDFEFAIAMILGNRGTVESNRTDVKVAEVEIDKRQSFQRDIIDISLG